jgi:hypothetical protein
MCVRKSKASLQQLAQKTEQKMGVQVVFGTVQVSSVSILVLTN